MNQVYRLVFSRALGVMQVASEFARRPGGTRTGGKAALVGAATVPLRAALACALGLVGSTMGVVSLPAHAQAAPERIVGDANAPGNQRPVVLAAPNGVPVVNIATPSAAGVSRNRYSQFDVPAQGAVLNNARGSTQTELGGWVQGNPWLATGSAKVILNEVNGPASRINGHLEVAGPRTEVILANPAGIQVDGGGFINVSRATLTTGSPVFNSGELEHYRVSGGLVRIQGDGLDGSRTDYTGLITRALQLNAGVWAPKLQVTLGSNTVSADQGQVTATTTTADDARPAYALDVAALGGMYANKIVLLGTEQGLGVRNAGSLGAQAGELVVTAAGRLENTGLLQSRQDIRLDVEGGVANAGTISAARELRIATPADIDNRRGTLNAARVQIDAAALQNRDGAIEQTGMQALALNTGLLRNREGGRIGPLPAASPPTTPNLVDTGATAGSPAGRDQPANPPSAPGSDAPGIAPVEPAPASVMLADGALNIAGALDNSGGRIDSAGGIALQGTQGLDNAGGQLGLASLTLRGDLDNQGGTLAIERDADLRDGRLLNRDGQLSVRGALALDLDSVDNRGGGLLHVGAAPVQWRIGGLLDNDDGLIASNASRLALSAGALGNANGRIQHTGDAGLLLRTGQWRGAGGSLATAGDAELVAGHVDHQGATLEARQLNLDAVAFDNRGGQLLLGGAGANALRVGGVLDNGGGRLRTAGDLALQAGAVGNQAGVIEHQGNGQLDARVGQWQGADGQLLGWEGLQLTGTHLDLQRATTQARRISLQADQLDHAGGQLGASGQQALQLQVRDTLDNTGGNIAGNGALQLTAGAVHNAGGTLSASGRADSRLEVAGTLDNTDGSIVLNADTVQVRAAQLVNTRGDVGHAGQQLLQLNLDRLDGSEGKLISAGRLKLDAATVDQRQATLQARAFDITGGQFDNRAGHLVATGDGASRIDLQSLDNGDGQIASHDDLAILAQDFGNTRGQVVHEGAGALSIAAIRLDGHEGKLQSNGALQLSGQTTHLHNATTQARDIAIETGELVTTGGKLIATGEAMLRLKVRDTLDNTAGEIGGNGTLALDAGRVLNTGGSLQAAGTGASDLSIANALENQGGTLLLGGAATLHAGRIDNQGGQLDIRGDSLVLDVDGLLDNQALGQVSSGGRLDLRADALDNREGSLSALTGLKAATAGTLDNRKGTIDAVQGVMLESLGLSNQLGSVIGAQLDIDTREQLLDNSGGTLGSRRGPLNVRSGELRNAAGVVQSAGDLRIDSHGQAITNTNSGEQGGLLAGGSLQLDGGTFDNRAGVVFAIGNARLATGTLDNRQGGTLASSADLTLTAPKLDNAGGQIQAAGQAQLVLDGELGNRGGRVAARGVLDVAAAHIDNRDTDTEASDLGLQGARLQVAAGSLDNRGGQLLATEHGLLAITGTLDNTAGQLHSDGALEVAPDTLLNESGVLHAGTRLDLDARRLEGTGLIEAGADAIVDLRESLVHTGTMAAGGTLRLGIDGDLDNRGLLNGGHVEVHARLIDNAASGEISSQGTTRLIATDTVRNRGLIDGATTHVQAPTLDNLGTGRLYGDHLAIAAGTLRNHGETLDGTTRAGTLAARERLDLGVGSLSNTDQALIFSDGDAALGATLDGNLRATGTADSVDNRGATIEIAGDLALNARAIANVRENIVVGLRSTIKAPVRLDQPTWRHNGKNATDDIRSSSNYQAYEVYYLDPRDILEDTPYITPDGYAVRRAVITLTPQTTAYFFGRGGLYAAKGERARLDPRQGTVTIYYTGRQDHQVNPDQVRNGADDPFRELSAEQDGSPAFGYVDDNLAYSNAYGNCSTDCVQLWAQYAYIDPERILSNPHGTGGGGLQDNEQYRIATQSVVEDVLESAGPDAVIHAGGKMRVETDLLRNEYGTIAAGNDVTIQGLTRQAPVQNVFRTLVRSYTFNNLSYGYNDSARAWSNPALSEEIGRIGGVIRSGGLLDVDIGDLGNFDEGRVAPGLVDRAQVANLAPAPVVASLGDASGQPSDGPRLAAGVPLAAADAYEPLAAGVVRPGRDGGVPASGSPDRIVMGQVDTRAPAASLFKLDPGHGQYLVETDPRFASYRDWLGSDYLLRQLGSDPASLHKRLGDGYYEQKLVREQIDELTGRRFLEGHASDEDQFRALLDAGATYAQQFGLRPGLALSAAQMAQLTSDIVWLVERTVTLPDGSTTTVLAPQVYLRIREGDLDPRGALLAEAVDLKLSGALTNQGRIAGRELVKIDAARIDQLRGGLIAGDRVGLKSQSDINVIGGTVTAVEALSVQAAGNVNVVTTTQTQAGAGFDSMAIDRVAGLYVTGSSATGALMVQAGGDITSQAGKFGNAGSGITMLSAGNDLNLRTQTVSERRDSAGTPGNHQRSEDTQHAVTTIEGQGNVVLRAGHDINLDGTQVTAGGSLAAVAGHDINSRAVVDSSSRERRSATGNHTLATAATHEVVHGTGLSANGDIALQADRDITLQATNARSESGGIAVAAGRDLKLSTADEHYALSVDKVDKKKGALSKTTKTTHDAYGGTNAVGSSLSGERVDLAAGRDLSARAAAVAGDKGVSLTAGNDIAIESGANASSESHTRDKQQTGAFGNGGIGFTIGKQTTGNTSQVRSSTYTGSVIGSSEGRVDIVAGNNVSIAGSDVLSKAGTLIAGEKVTITHIEDSENVGQTEYAKSGGLNVSLRGGVADVANALYAATQRGSEVEDDRLKVLYAAKGAQVLFSGGESSGLNTLKNVSGQAKQAVADAQNGTQSAGGLSLRIGIGGSSSKNEVQSQQANAQGSRIASEGDVAIVARSGDITISGSQVQGDNVALAAARDILLKSAEQRYAQTEKSKASSGEIGITIGSEAGFGIYVSASGAKGRGNGSGTSYEETTIQANSTLTLVSGRDTVLDGAQAIGDRVVADIGRNLIATSQQDRNTYERKDQAAGIDVAIGTGGGQVSGYYNQQKIDSNYVSVEKQTGIQAGNGGFDINVGGHTQLDGAAIASRADPANNYFSTGSLGWSDLKNSAEYSASSVGASGGVGSSGGSFSPDLSSPQNESSASTTQAGIANGTWVVRDGSGGDIARGVTELQQDGLKQIFDAQKVAGKLEMGQLAGQVGMHAAGSLADEMGWAEGSKEKAILHGAVGAAMAALGGGTAVQGMGGAAASQLASGAMQDYLRNANVDPNSSEGRLLMELGSAAVGAAVGGGSGAATALAGEQFNRQLHPDESQWIRDNAEEFAAQLYDCGQSCTPQQIEAAGNRLTIEAAARVDAVMSERTAGTDDQAQAFINSRPVKFAWGNGFIPTREQYQKFKHFEDLLGRDKQALKDLAAALGSAGWSKRDFQDAYHDVLLIAADQARGETGQAIIETFTGDLGFALGVVRKIIEGDTSGVVTDGVLAALPWGIGKTLGGLRPVASAEGDLLWLNGKTISETWVNAKGELTWLNPLTGAKEAVPDTATVHVDHILPKAVIKEIDGFTALPKDLQNQLLNDPVNLQPMVGPANCSKGCKVEGVGGGWETWNGQPVSAGYKRDLADKQRAVRAKVNDAIKEYESE